MTPDQLPNPYLLFLTDPILQAGCLLPFVLLAGVLIYRIRMSRRIAALTQRNAEAIERNEARWEESAARTEKMIELLAEIRDHATRLAPDSRSS